MLQHSESTLINRKNDEFIDTHEESIFFDASETFKSEHPLSVSNSSSVHDPDNSNQDSVSKLSGTPDFQSGPFSTGLRRRRLFSRKEYGFKNSSVGLADFEVHGSDVSSTKSCKLLWNLKDDYKSNEPNGDSVNSSDIITLNDDERINDRSVTVDSPITGSNFVFTIVRLIIHLISFKTSLFVAFVTFPIWLTHSSYMFVTDPFAVTTRAKRYMIKRISRFLNSFLGNLKQFVYKWIKRKKSILKICMKIGWGLLRSAFVGLVLVGLLVFAFVVGAAIMKCVVEVPVHRIEQLNFDYTVDSPMAFVPIMSCESCHEPFRLESNEKIEFDNVGHSRVIPLDHKLQASVLLILPESDYNRNLGNFQVRVDFLSSNGKSLASTTQPSTMHFKSWPVRLLMTVFKLAPLITGYSLESQTLDIKFNGYTEREIPTCCVRVALEPRAEFALNGGIPEIYTAYLKLESQLPLLKRILWSWKATVFVWISIIIFTMGLFFLLLCCIPVFVPWLRLRGGAPLNNTRSR
ncbi:hypothetical protein R6Q57_010557 [Mikania cordata]